MRQLLVVTFLLILIGRVSAADPIVATDAPLKAEGNVAFTEGPAWHPNGNVYFSDIANNRIMRKDPKGVLHTHRTPSGRTNGLVFDLEGRLICCEGGGAESNRQVTRLEHDGTITVLAAKFEGKRLNSPNDCTIDAKGRIFFSDPRYRNPVGLAQFDRAGKRIEGVYRIDADGSIHRIITHEISRPNGLAVSPDQKHLFVAEHVNEGDGPQNRKLWRFDLKPDGTIGKNSQKLLFDWGSDRGPDGMAIDTNSNLYVTAGFNHPAPRQTVKKYKAGVYVISPEGKLLHFIAVPMDMITNCAFGGKNLKTLYITAGHTLWSIPTNATGYVEWLKKRD
jgi:gluconolactonase